MDQQPTVQQMPQLPSNEPQRNGSLGKKIGIILLVLVAVAALAYSVFAFLDNSRLQSELDKEKFAANSPVVSPSEETSDSEAEVAAQPLTYTASVGKFKLSLPSGYGIVRQLDGQGEGSPATILEIVKSTDSDNLYEYISLKGTVQLTASAATGSSYDTLVNNTLYPANSTLKYDKSAATDTFDGVSAEKYTQIGGYSRQFIFFTKNSIFYTIEAPATDADSKAISAIAKGFTFE